MKGTIQWVRHYHFYNSECVDVMYESGRLCTWYDEAIPNTIRKWMEEKEGRKQVDGLHGDEVIYE